MEFTLCNANSINLNFILYIIDIYDKKVNLTDNFFITNELYDNIPNIWNEMVQKFKPINGKCCNSSFVNWDKELLQEKDVYKTLFKNTEEGYKEYLKIWEKYLEWWHSECQVILNKQMDEFIPVIYEVVKHKLILNKGYLPVNNFAIEIVCSKVPKNCLTEGTLFTIESIDDFYSEFGIDKISERIYNLILSKY